MSTRLSWSPAQITLAAQANKALYVLNKVNYNCDYSFQCACQMFDKCVIPIISYGAEIWGSEVHSSIERVHTKFCKQQLGVGINTPNCAALGECGRDSVYVYCFIKCIKYWLKLISLPEQSLLKSCYNLQYKSCILGKTNWASNIRDILFRYGFGSIWEEQNVADNAAFIKVFRERIQDCELQRWASEVRDTAKLRTYRLFKEERIEEFYL